MVVVLLVLYVGHVAYAIVENRFLFADGVNFFIHVLVRGDVYAGGRNTHRLFANILTQSPLLVAIRTGVTDLHVLGRFYGTGLFMPYLVCVAIWLWTTARQPEHFLFLLVFLFAAAMNTEFFLVSESHTAASLCLGLLALILFREPWGPFTAVLAAILALFTLRSYESMLFLGPMLAVAALWRRARCRAPLPRAGWLGLAGWFLAGAGVSLDAVLHPAIPGIDHVTLAKQAVSLLRDHMLAVFTGSTDLDYQALVSVAAIALVVIAFVRSGAIRRYFPAAVWGFAALCFAVITLLYLHPELLEMRLHYAARSLNVLVPALISVFVLITKSRGVALETGSVQRAFRVVLVLGFFQAAWHGLATWQWAGYLDAFAGELSSQRGFVHYEDSVLSEQRIARQSIANMNWRWTMPEMSIVLAPGGMVKAVIGNPAGTDWQPFDPLDPAELPDLSRYGVTYAPYLASLGDRD